MGATSLRLALPSSRQLGLSSPKEKERYTAPLAVGSGSSIALLFVAQVAARVGGLLSPRTLGPWAVAPCLPARRPLLEEDVGGVLDLGDAAREDHCLTSAAIACVDVGVDEGLTGACLEVKHLADGRPIGLHPVHEEDMRLDMLRMVPILALLLAVDRVPREPVQVTIREVLHDGAIPLEGEV